MPARAGVLLAGRGLIALLFILAGGAKVAGPAPFLAHMAQHGVPGMLLYAVAALEIGAGTAVLLGWRLRWSAGALALFCVATALVFHLNLADHAERTSFFKDLAIAGGLAVLATGG
jgi:putative oxidoreductase